MTRQRSQPALIPAVTEAVCPAGTNTVISPGLLSPPVLSVPVSQGTQRAPSHASHTSGGCRGSTPTPSTRLSRRTATMHRGTAVGSPNSRASPGSGRDWKQGMSLPAPSGAVRSVWSPDAGAVTSLVSELGTIARSSVVEKTTASSVSPRAVATSVPAGSRMVSGCGADSQKSTSARATVGGNSWTPSRSRKAE